MENIDCKLMTKDDIIIITKNLNVLLYYDEPILYYGQNEYDSYIIGAAVDEDVENGINRHSHIMVTKEELSQFLNNKITLLELFKKHYNKIYIVDTIYQKEGFVIYKLDLESLPFVYLPDEDSYCPEEEKNYDTLYITLKPKDSLHQIPLRYLKYIEEKFYSIINSGSKILEDLYQYQVNSYIEAFQPSSFKIKLNLDIQKKENCKNELFKSTEYVQEVYYNYNKLILSEIHNDISTLSNSPQENTIFKMITDRIGETISIDEKLNDKIIQGACSSYVEMLELWDEIGDTLTSIDVSFANNETEQPLVVVDNKYRIESKNNEIGVSGILNKGTSEDIEFKEYKIGIYQLSKKTRKGKAYILDDQQKDDKLFPCSIDIMGEDFIEETPFTESFFTGNDLNVLAKARKKNGKIVHLNIKYENKAEYDHRLMSSE